MAIRLIDAVLVRRKSLDDALADTDGQMDRRDRAFAHAIAATVLRRLGTLDAILAEFLTKPLPDDSGPTRAILRAGAAQLMLMHTPPHAAISLSVDLAKRHARSRRYAGLINAVLRRVSQRRSELPTLGPSGGPLDIPAWMWLRWVSNYGAETAAVIARASLAEAALDITPKSDPDVWAERLGGHLLPTGTVRVADPGRVEELPGFAEGDWWVQDAAAALPSRLIAAAPAIEIADLCAAPGGKSASLAARGGRVWAVDVSATRLDRLAANMARLGLGDRVTPVVSDVLSWQPDRHFDAVLLDAPCLSTGTIRRHPDILHLKRPGDVAALADLQARLVDRAAALVRPGGTLVYCTCSLEPEEGEQQIAGLLSRRPDIVRVPIAPGEAGIDAAWVTADGDLRTLPHYLPNADPRLSGMDGFYAARLRVGE